MKRRFNVLGNCVPDKHYMVDTTDKLAQIQTMVDDGLYFTINRARQYGKTTTLGLLRKALMNDYMCIHMSFENAGKVMFDSVEGFCERFLWQVEKAIKPFYPEQAGMWQNNDIRDFNLLGEHISSLCENKKIILIIDEVDRASNYSVFLMFLAMLRDKYIDRNNGLGTTFHSVILAGVVDIKNIKLVMEQKGFIVRNEGETLSVSPWNIAADFEVDMSFSPFNIATMLHQYEADYHTGMDIAAVSQEIYNYTNGYPYLVSRICQHIDSKLNKDWTVRSVRSAVRIILKENNTLFDDIIKNMENNVGLYKLLQEMLFTNFTEPNSYRTPEIQLGLMYGILAVHDGLDISNIIFKTIITDYIVEKNKAETREKTVLYFQNPYIVDNKLNMELIMRKFSEFMYEEYREADARFIEQNGRLLFLSFLKPIINGHGFTFVETETRLAKRMDIVVVYENHQYIIELKLWYGDVMHIKAYDQILNYMDSKGLAEGYLLTFDFRRDANKERKAEWIESHGKRIFDVIV